jgi:heme oxygenase
VSAVPIASTSLLTDLRAHTKSAHQRLEAGLDLLDETLSREDYLEVLKSFYGFWRSWQPLCAALIADDGLTRPRNRLPLLQQDLLALGLSEAELTTLPACPPPGLANAGQALGSLYVMEGSTLGGRVIAKSLAQRFGLGPTNGAAYFAGYGEHKTAPMWRLFLDYLERAPAASGPDIIAGADLTFTALREWVAT